MIKVIFFDFGGVLIEVVHSTFAAEVQNRYGVDPGVADRWWSEQDDDYYAGRMGGDAFFSHYATIVGLDAEPAELERLYVSCLREKPGTWQLARRLAGQVALSVISDMAPAPTAYIRQHFDMELFAKPLFSSEVGLTKRDERLFRLALTRHGITAAEALLIDDAPRNILIAAELGMDTVLFESVEQLVAELARRGLVFEPDPGVRPPRPCAAGERDLG